MSSGINRYDLEEHHTCVCGWEGDVEVRYDGLEGTWDCAGCLTENDVYRGDCE